MSEELCQHCAIRCFGDAAEFNFEALGIVAFIYGSVWILLWVRKLVLLLKNISRNLLTISHIITVNMLLGAMGYVTTASTMVLKSADPDTVCNALNTTTYFLVLQFFTGQMIYCGWFFLWGLSLCIFVTPMKRRVFATIHKSVSMLCLLIEYAAMGIFAYHKFDDDDPSSHHIEQAIATAIGVVNYLFMLYCTLLFLVIFSLMYGKFWHYTPTIIREAWAIWVTHLLLMIAMIFSVFFLPFGVLKISLNHDHGDNDSDFIIFCAITIFFYTTLMQVCIYACISCHPPSERASFSVDPNVDLLSDPEPSFHLQDSSSAHGSFRIPVTSDDW